MKVSNSLAAGVQQCQMSANRAERMWFQQRTAGFIFGASLVLWAAIALVSYWFF